MNVFTYAAKARIFEQALAFFAMMSLVLSVFATMPLTANATTATATSIEVSVLPDPSGVSDDDGEYIKITYVGLGTLELSGWNVQDTSTLLDHTFAGGSLNTGDTYTICANASSTENGGISCDEEWTGGGLLNNTGTETVTLYNHVGSAIVVVSFTNAASDTVYTDSVSDTEVYGDQDHISICHSANGKNYVQNAPNVDAFVNLYEQDKNGHHDHGPDIIPPFFYDTNNGTGYYPGKNWTTGEAIWNAGCKDPNGDYAAISFIKVVDNEPNADLTQFGFVMSSKNGTDHASSGDTFYVETKKNGSEAYTITEDVIPSGYTLKEISCVGPTTATGSASVVLDVKKDEEYTCTITNHKEITYTVSTSTLTIVKQLAGDAASSTQFDFTVDATNDTYDSAPSIVDAGTTTITDLPADTYTITEATGSFVDWSLTNVSCTAGSSSVNAITDGVSIDMEVGDDVVCTFTNTYTTPTNPVYGCTDPAAYNYEQAATHDNGSCLYYGCTDSTATNYDPDATTDDGTCTYPAQCIPGVNILENPSFEEPVLNSAWSLVDPVGWVSQAVAGLVNIKMEIQRSVNGWLPSDGDQYAELDSTESSQLSQTHETVLGATYSLSWDFAGRPNTFQNNNDLRVLIDGVEVAKNTAPGEAPVNWQSDSYEFKGTGTSTVITFMDAGVSDSLGTFLDNIALVCEPLPEPGPYCGDGDINQAWEQCEVGDEGCTEYCTVANQCLSPDLKLAKITLDSAPASVSFDNTIYLGEADNPIPSGAWFNLDELDATNTPAQLAKQVEGLAVIRENGNLVLAVEGGNESNEFDYVFADIDFIGADADGLDRNPVVGWPLEDTGSYVDVFENINNSIRMEWYLTTGDDSGAIEYEADAYCEETATYIIEGYVWHDENENEIWDGHNDENEEVLEEDILSGWTVWITNGTSTYSTTTDQTGYYWFEVPAGTWTITEEVEDGWERTTQEKHIVTVPEIFAYETTLMDRLFAFIIPTAHAAIEGYYGEYNFGNAQEDSSTGGGGRSGGGGRRSTGSTAGDSTDVPAGQVLGEQVSVVPTGAPNAGAGGGQSPVSQPFTQIVTLLGIAVRMKEEHES